MSANSTTGSGFDWLVLGSGAEAEPQCEQFSRRQGLITLCESVSLHTTHFPGHWQNYISQATKTTACRALRVHVGEKKSLSQQISCGGVHQHLQPAGDRHGRIWASARRQVRGHPGVNEPLFQNKQTNKNQINKTQWHSSSMHFSMCLWPPYTAHFIAHLSWKENIVYI